MEQPVTTTIASWRDFSKDYESKVLSVTSFAAKRQQILDDVLPGVILDLGCGPLGLLLRALSRLPNTSPIGLDSSPEMLRESCRHTRKSNVHYLLGDVRWLPLKSSSVDTVVTINSFVPEIRQDIDRSFAEAARVLRKGGRLIAVLPSFEMSMIARDQWGMKLDVDLENHREWDTVGWQCFYTEKDIREIMQKHHFQYRLRRMVFDAPAEIAHVQRVYAHGLATVPREQMIKHPLFEHFLVAERQNGDELNI